MKTKLVKVTPEIAAGWLAKNENNRPISRTAVDVHKRNLVAKKFRTTHQGIGLDSRGRLLDGQHRLQAIVETGIAASLLVTEGLSERDMQAIDDGRKRTAHDILSMAHRGTVSAFTTALAREMYIGGWHFAEGVKRRVPSRQELVDFYITHAAAIDDASDKLKAQNSGLRLSYIGAVIARARGQVAERKLSAFAKALNTGMYTSDDLEPVIKLRNQIQRVLKDGARGIRTRDEIYAKTENVLYLFAHNESMGQIRAATTELFPLPGEQPPLVVKP